MGAWGLKGKVAAVAFGAAVILAGAAEAGERPVVSLLVENDVFAGTDRNYSNGLKASFVSPWGDEDEFGNWIVSSLWPGEPDVRLRNVYSLGHSIFTPDDLSSSLPLPDQRPYAGYLYGVYALVAEGRYHSTAVEIEAGLVGPGALGEEIQRGFHNRFDFEDPQGWDNQLENEPTIALTLERTWRFVMPVEMLGLETAFQPSLGGTLGNLRTEGFAGATVRVGTDLEGSFLPPRVRPSIAGSGFFSPKSGVSAYGFVGVVGRAVAQNIFLDGNTFEDSLSVDKKHFGYDVQAGLAMQIGQVQLSYTYVLRSEEFEGQVGNDQFGAIGISVRI